MNAYINILVLSLVILLMTTSCGKSTSNYNTQVGVIHRDVKDTVFQTPHGYTFYDVEEKLQTVCIRNVVYYQVMGLRHGYMAPAFKPEGTLYTCNR